ncbi:unnamed protein product [Cyberlindnera jadinii]|uniref:54S ribosomal protein L31, mitochondrial n=1 Tax=Cyberlindnera jadinii (strain ATCC 18201 / CBS 1600 / BCRC 20928 / JCM 3617 / NBRC 0987 / NRRL Y-1542) TaxID=983966 RepID=A0A0H5C3J2_CYBJN|nr:unnamed protein product [Cyberlindnera jadinii]
MSQTQKYRHRKRLQQVDSVVSTVLGGLKKENLAPSNLLAQYSKFPKEEEMTTLNKYTVFNRFSKGYRKSIHRTPHWTKKSQRVNPEHF